ncbi:MAG: hypothetical protein M1832_000390 [Thelocarpon impressellum]|nr:MAG: hypothetical protein M1832_000390 [Thelocarpon impressellum]
MADPVLDKEVQSKDPESAGTNVNRARAAISETLTNVKTADDLSPLETEKIQSDRPGQFPTHSSAYSGVTESEYAPSEKSTEAKREWHQRLNPLRRSRKPPVPKERTVSPEYGASFFSRLTFHWMAPLMRVGYQRPLELNDIWLVNPNRSAEALTERLSASFKRRVARGDKYPLLWALHETFKLEFWVGGTCQLFASIFQVMSPFVLRYLIAFATEAYAAQRNPGSSPNPHIGNGLALVFGITIMQILQCLGTSHFIYRGMMVGGQTRAVLIAVIFEKSMKISGRAKAGGKAITDVATDDKPEKETIPKEGVASKGAPGVSGDGVGWANGRVVNLMSTDTYRIDQASGMFHIIWTAPLAMIITLVVLVINLTYSALAGFALLVLGTPLITKAIKSLFIRRRAINKITDQRVSLTQEIIQAVRFVKYFGWESSFLERLGEIRDREIYAIQILLTIRSAINAVSMSLPIFASMLAFITYALTTHELSPARIFSSLALFNSLRLPLNLLPTVIGQVTDGWASMGRIEEFLLAEEIQDDFEWDAEGEAAVSAKNADFTWERTATQDPDRLPIAASPGAKDQPKVTKKGEDLEKENARSKESDGGNADAEGTDTSSAVTEREPFKLHGMDFTIGRNELIAVIGGVGSGKSSLLAALAGDMRKESGQIVMGASRAFCPQYAWIQNATVKDNILFGKECDPVWYDKVLEACALKPDLEVLPNGDLTEIGERGITVSGGQKQRLNIARAIYFDADIILMDDPLSAVDAHVGRHIFDHAISGLMRDKCRILATHQLHVLNRCDRIIWLRDGRIEAFDTYDNLMAQNEGFAKMMVTTAPEREVDDESSSDEDVEVKEKARSKKKTKKSKPAAALMQVEERAVKSVSWGVYGAYIKASGTLLNGPLVIMLLIISQSANIATSLWLSYWVSNKFDLSMGAYIGIYAGLGVVQAFLMFFFAVILTIFGTRSSKVMLNRAMTRALRAPMSFFDTTPLGRITNRFSKDVDTMDNNLTDAMRQVIRHLAPPTGPGADIL